MREIVSPRLVVPTLVIALTAVYCFEVKPQPTVVIKNDTKTFTHQFKLPVLTKPTFEDMKQCEGRRGKCLETCDDKKNATCKLHCPICPILKEVPFIIPGFNDTVITKEEPTEQSQNFTTVIRMKNIIHNILDVLPPPNVNTTNNNVVNIYQNHTSKTGGKFGMGFNEQGQCCLEVHPKQCQMTMMGPSCANKKRRACGPQCTSRIVHLRKVKICTAEGSCQQRANYYAEPSRPRCVSINRWPFVSCGGQYTDDCQSCVGFEDEDPEALIPKRCVPCFSGFNQGPYYRRGPVFGPSHPHDFGGYGFDEGPEIEEALDGSGEGGTEFNPEEWKIEARRCKRTHKNGTVEITNCEDLTFDEDRLAAHTLDFPGGVDKGRRRRRARHHTRARRSVDIISDQF